MCQRDCQATRIQGGHLAWKICQQSCRPVRPSANIEETREKNWRIWDVGGDQQLPGSDIHPRCQDRTGESFKFEDFHQFLSLKKAFQVDLESEANSNRQEEDVKFKNSQKSFQEYFESEDIKSSPEMLREYCKLENMIGGPREQIDYFDPKKTNYCSELSKEYFEPGDVKYSQQLPKEYLKFEEMDHALGVEEEFLDQKKVKYYSGYSKEYFEDLKYSPPLHNDTAVN